MLDIFNWIKILTTEIQFKILESKWRRWETMTKLTWPKVVLMQKGGNLEEIKVIAGKNNMTARTGREVTQQSKELCCQRKLWKETLGKLPYFAVTIIWDFRINWKPKIQGVLFSFITTLAPTQWQCLWMGELRTSLSCLVLGENQVDQGIWWVNVQGKESADMRMDTRLCF